MGKYYFNSNIEKIILTGDSAGGNMAISTVYRAMKFGVRIPDGMYLIYPALTATMKTYYQNLNNSVRPSNLDGVCDRMLPSSLMLAAMYAYTKA